VRTALAVALVALTVGPARADEFSGRVVGVTDGDTISVLRDQRAVTIRLEGIDAPEKSQAFGQRARQFAAAQAFGQTVTVHVSGRDRYGRLLADVILPDGRSLNQELVRAGYAWWFRKYSHDMRLARLEAEAREEHRGLWADPAPEAPWNYRSRRAS
jgi:micrococcal nuclease